MPRRATSSWIIIFVKYYAVSYPFIKQKKVISRLLLAVANYYKFIRSPLETIFWKTELSIRSDTLLERVKLFYRKRESATMRGVCATIFAVGRLPRRTCCWRQRCCFDSCRDWGRPCGTEWKTEEGVGASWVDEVAAASLHCHSYLPVKLSTQH